MIGLRSAAALAVTETRLFGREPFAVFFSLAFPLILLLFVGSVGGGVAELPEGGALHRRLYGSHGGRHSCKRRAHGYVYPCRGEPWPGCLETLPPLADALLGVFHGPVRHRADSFGGLDRGARLHYNSVVRTPNSGERSGIHTCEFDFALRHTEFWAALGRPPLTSAQCPSGLRGGFLLGVLRQWCRVAPGLIPWLASPSLRLQSIDHHQRVTHEFLR